jgi:hypothetical protein
VLARNTQDFVFFTFAMKASSATLSPWKHDAKALCFHCETSGFAGVEESVRASKKRVAEDQIQSFACVHREDRLNWIERVDWARRASYEPAANALASTRGRVRISSKAIEVRMQRKSLDVTLQKTHSG